MQPLYQRQGFEIKRTDMIEPNFPHSRLNLPCNGLHCVTPFCCFVIATRPCFPAVDAPQYRPWSKFDLNNTIKIKFICDGEWSIELTIKVTTATFDSRCHNC